MKYLLSALISVMALGLLAGPSEAREARTKPQAMKQQAIGPEQFIQKVANANQFEIQSSQIALDKSKNDDIRKFAQRMIDDHTKMADELKTKLQQANMPLPSDQLDPQDQAALTKLKSEKEPLFDRAYVAAQRRGNIKAVQLLESYSKTGTIPPLKELAAKTLPTIQEHLKMAEALPLGANLTARAKKTRY